MTLAGKSRLPHDADDGNRMREGARLPIVGRDNLEEELSMVDAKERSTGPLPRLAVGALGAGLLAAGWAWLAMSDRALQVRTRGRLSQTGEG